MTIQVHLNKEVEERLLAEARAQGTTLEKLAERLLQEALASRPNKNADLSIEEFHEMLNSLAKDSGELPNLQTESFTRESFYQDSN